MEPTWTARGGTSCTPLSFGADHPRPFKSIAYTFFVPSRPIRRNAGKIGLNVANVKLYFRVRGLFQLIARFGWNRGIGGVLGKLYFGARRRVLRSTFRPFGTTDRLKRWSSLQVNVWLHDAALGKRKTHAKDAKEVMSSLVPPTFAPAPCQPLSW